MTSNIRRRAKALDRLEILDTESEESFDAIARLASAICDTPFAALSFLDGDRQWFKSAVGLGMRETPLSESFCNYTAEQTDVMVVNDASIDRRFMNNALVVGDPKLRFYAGCALRAPDGTAIGAVCVLGPEARPHGLSPTQRTALQVLARQVEDQLELRVALREGRAQVAALERLTEELAYQGSHDPLTLLPNRSLFAARLEEGFDECRRTGASLTLVLLDIDHFKQTNDSQGHDAGDALLLGFATSLQAVVRKRDTVARIGGDEFALILVDVPDEGATPETIEQIGKRIKWPVQHRGANIECRASIGMSTYPKDATDALALMKCSDLALASAKLNRGSAVAFDDTLLREFDEQRQMVEAVRVGFAGDAFEPYYQPKISLTTGQRVGFEALMRWPSAGPEAPSIFDPGFPDKALVARIGLRMIEKILEDLRGWMASGLHVGRIAINSSAIDFAGDCFAENLLQQLKIRNLPASAIELEVTEGILLGRGASYIARALTMLRAAGVSIALDDFGTGYASLVHLRQFPLDVIKIDQSFVRGITRNIDDASIVRSVIGLAKNLGVTTVAEGVETPAQEAFIRHHGCDVGQGYLYGVAIPASAVRASNERRFVVA